MSEQQNEDVEHKVVVKGPGDLLQAARIEQGITVEDIARQMNLNARILQSIEDDDYGEIQSPIFMRGYLRTYSRLVGVDEEQVIKIFADFYQVEDPDIKTIGNTAPQISSNDIRVKWMTYAVIIGLLALISVWWVNNYRTTDNVDAALPESTMGVNETFDPVNDTTSIQSEESLPLLVAPTKIVEKNVKEEADITVKAEALSIDVANNDQIDNVKTTTNIEEPISLEAEVALTTSIEEKNDGNLDSQLKSTEDKQFTKEVVATSGSDVLELNVISDSWGEIKDASKFKLIQDLMNSGSRFRLVGQKPFKIFLGNGYGVEIKLNGKTVDFSNHIKSSNNTARFELDKS